MKYQDFIASKSQLKNDNGFEPVWLPDCLFGFQRSLCDWSIRRGRAATYSDCGTGKSLMQLVWAENVVRKTNRPVLILTPMTVAPQTVQEGAKFGIEAEHSRDGKFTKKIVVSNYERLHYFNKNDFEAVALDEGGIIKHFGGATQKLVTDFVSKHSYRSLYTATAAPNDFIELGTAAEALGQIGRMEMLGMFFKNSGNTMHPSWWGARWTFKAHSEKPFWRWVCSWARALRKPSDLGFSDDGFILPELVTRETIIKNSRPFEGELFPVQAVGLRDQRAERKATLEPRCEEVARKCAEHDCSLVWCHLNTEGELLEKILPNSRQIAGDTPEEEREEIIEWFTRGTGKRTLISKPVCLGFGMNFQHCAHMTFFPSHSFEQYYQGVRRCWRFGQKRPVTVDVITTEGELGVLKNLQRKSEQADQMFRELVANMNNSLAVQAHLAGEMNADMPEWL